MNSNIPCKTEIVRAQAGRLLNTFGFRYSGTALAKVLEPDTSDINNFEALESWICEHIRRYYLPLDHTLSSQLDRCIVPLVRYIWPERYQRPF